MKRVTVIVLDSLGVGALPDAADYGDEGTNTFDHVCDAMKPLGGLKIPNLTKLGFGNISDSRGNRIAGGAFANPEALGAFGRMAELSTGKDTVTGHWELAGVETKTPLQSFENGMPESFISEFEKAIGRKVLGNYNESGTVIIDELGALHEITGKPIVYTSIDSVFQIAANTAIIPLEELYDICKTAREMLVGDLLVGRVIARPYTIDDQGRRVRTGDRRDYGLTPPAETVPDKISKAGMTTCAIGKINDIFAGAGFTQSIHTDNNMQGITETVNALKNQFDGLIFTNLVDFDSLFGHRRDPVGYGRALEEFDARLPEITGAMQEGDLLIICGDHGTDPTHFGYHHTREYVPVVYYGEGVKPGAEVPRGETFADVGATVCAFLGIAGPDIGRNILPYIGTAN